VLIKTDIFQKFFTTIASFISSNLLFFVNNYITIFNLWSEKKGRELMKKEIQKEKYEKTKINGMSYIRPNW